MKTIVEILLQFGVAGGTLAVLAFYIWTHGRMDRASARRWEETAHQLALQNQQVLEVIKVNTDVLRENHQVLAVVRDRLNY